MQRFTPYLGLFALALLMPFASHGETEETSTSQRPIELSVEQIEQILTPGVLEEKSSYRGDLPQDLVDRVVHRAQSLLHFKTVHAADGNLDANECVMGTWDEAAYRYAPDDLQGSLEEVVSAADLVFVGEVLSRETFFSYRNFKTRVFVQIEEVWPPAPEAIEPGDIVRYTTLDYDLMAGEERLCTTPREGALPSPGERLLFLGFPIDEAVRSKGHLPKSELAVTNFFRIDGSLAIPTQYLFLQDAEPQSLEHLQDERAGSAPNPKHEDLSIGSEQ
ncbi:MAG: hypothetical protein SX243_09285 [Acidobacteriota bacterium]|nr:hypothetical protein [Acidobacteriota bacterium]